MAVRTSRTLLSCTSGAVAPTVALALIGLIAAGGIAFDYSRLVGMHSELQNAADQAALAAATQLNGKAGARANARDKAQNLVTNRTLIANEAGGTRQIAMPSVSILFYQDRDGTTAATTDANARFAKVTTDGRQVFYALTPVVSLISSGSIVATAMAGLGSATCKVPPVMICNPAESTDPDFTVSDYAGKGLKLLSVGNGGGAWAPGNFGYLDANDGSNGANGLREALGWTSLPGDCSPDSGVNTKPGASVSVTDALNTRFDIYDNGQSCPSGGSCPPSANSTKDLVKSDGTNGNGCALHPQGWKVSDNPYLPSSTTPLSSNYPDAMGYPRDMCHAVSSGGTCAKGAVGDGLWDVDAYFYVNYGNVNHATWTAATGLGSGGASPYGVTRYDVYKWEMAHAGSVLNGQTVLGPRIVSGTGGNTLRSHGGPYCSTPGITPGGNTPDRRRISLAVVNCTANNVHGNSTNVPVQKWIDIFLVEPSLNRARTSQGDIYVEVIGQASSNGDGTAGQVVRRDVPYLVQ
jgi:Flp pilus assembly protein TadG